MAGICFKMPPSYVYMCVYVCSYWIICAYIGGSIYYAFSDVCLKLSKIIIKKVFNKYCSDDSISGRCSSEFASIFSCFFWFIFLCFVSWMFGIFDWGSNDKYMTGSRLYVTNSRNNLRPNLISSSRKDLGFLPTGSWDIHNNLVSHMIWRWDSVPLRNNQNLGHPYS